MSSSQYTFARTEPPPSGGEAPRLSYLSRARYSAEWNSNLHTHGCAELFFITDGHGQLRTQYEAFPVSIHDLVIVNGGVLHTELSQLEDPLEYIVLGVEGLALGQEPAPPRVSLECGMVRRYIDNHFKERMDLSQLAQLAHVNKYYLAHAFRREFGVSPISYLIQRRVEESRFLLRETDYSLSLIAEILGFSSLSYFSQSFHRVEGTSPTEYRRQNK